MTDLTAARPDPVEELRCSARGCRAEAAWGLLWNNPRLHTPERRKVWLACDEHREHLEQFLATRSFLRATVPVSELDVVAGPSGDAGPGPGGHVADGDRVAGGTGAAAEPGA